MSEKEPHNEQEPESTEEFAERIRKDALLAGIDAEIDFARNFIEKHDAEAAAKKIDRLTKLRDELMGLSLKEAQGKYNEFRTEEALAEKERSEKLKESRQQIFKGRPEKIQAPEELGIDIKYAAPETFEEGGALYEWAKWDAYDRYRAFERDVIIKDLGQGKSFGKARDEISEGNEDYTLAREGFEKYFGLGDVQTELYDQIMEELGVSEEEEKAHWGTPKILKKRDKKSKPSEEK